MLDYTFAKADLAVYRRQWSCVILTFVLLFAGVNISEAVPPVITPGGVEPDLNIEEMPKIPSSDIFPIPPVIDRPLGIDEGPKIVVSAFKIQGELAHPELENLLEEVKEMIDNKLATQGDGFTIGQLQEFANEITQHFRKAGFILAQAFIPEQTVENQVVIIRIMAGSLGSVITEGNKIYSSKALIRPFKHLIGKSINNKNLESGLLHLTDYPGLSVFGVFKPGDTVGTTNLVLNVQQERRFNASVSADNYGVDTTGQLRTVLQASLNNPLKQGDRFSGYLLKTYDPTKSIYGSLDYELPIFGHKTRLGIGASRNDYDIGKEFRELGIEGTSDQAYLNFNRSLVRSRNFNLYGQTGIALKRADVTNSSTNLDNEDNLTVVSLQFEFDSVNTRYSGVNQGVVQLSHGVADFLGSMDKEGNGKSLRINGNGNHVSGKFRKIWARIARLQSVNRNNSILFRLEGQYSPDSLSSLSQLSIGGPNKMRAYDASEFLFDTAWYASAEWISNAPGFSEKAAFSNRTWGELLQLSLFLDYAKGLLNSANQSDKRDKRHNRDLWGVGAAIQFNLPGRAFLRADFANPFREEREIEGDRDPQYWLTVRYEF